MNETNQPTESYSFSSVEVEQVISALSAAQRDIWQTARVSECNLTGKDLSFPDDPPIKLTAPRLIHRAGVDESLRVHAQVVAALRLLYQATIKP